MHVIDFSLLAVNQQQCILIDFSKKLESFKHYMWYAINIYNLNTFQY